MQSQAVLDAAASLIASTDFPAPSVTANACTEDQLMDSKDAFSHVKRIFIEQQVQASFAKQLRNGVAGRSTSGLFQNLDVNSAVEQQLHEDAKQATRDAKQEVLAKQEAMHEMCGAIATAYSSVRRHRSELQRAVDDLQEEIEQAPSSSYPAILVEMTVPISSSTSTSSTPSSSSSSTSVRMVELTEIDEAKAVLADQASILANAKQTVATLTSRKEELEVLFEKDTAMIQTLESELSTLTATRMAKEEMNMTTGKRAKTAIKHYTTLSGILSAATMSGGGM